VQTLPSTEMYVSIADVAAELRREERSLEQLARSAERSRGRDVVADFARSRRRGQLLGRLNRGRPARA